MSDMSLEQLLSELSHEDAPPEFDWSAPESGQFAPAVVPGTYDFIFKLREGAGVGGFDKMEYMGKKYLSVTFDAEVIQNGADPKLVTYQRVNAFKHEKVAISSLGELLRSLGLHTQLSQNAQVPEIVAVLQGASGRARGKGEACWRAYDKASGITICTAPRKRKGIKDTPWPRNADGSWQQTVAFASGGPKVYGQVEFIRYFTQKADAAS